MTRSILQLALAVLVLLGTPFRPAAAGSLPDPECVRLVREARIAETAGEVDRAVELLSQAVERFPDEVVTLQELLRVHLNHDLADERTQELQRELVARVSDPERQLSPGSIVFLVRHAGDDPEILSALLESVRARLERRPDDLELLQARASLEGTLGLEREARATLETLLKLDPSYTIAFRAIRLDLALENWDSAMNLAERWLDDPQFGPAVRRIYLDILARSGRTEDLIAGLEKLEATRSDDTLSDAAHRAHLKRIAWSLLDAGEATFAERLFREVLEDNPADLEAGRVVANLFATEDERRELTAQVEQQVDAIEEPFFLLEQAIQYLATGDAGRAIEIFSRLTDEYDAKEEFWFNYGVAAIAVEEWQTAADAFGRAAELNPERAENHFQGARALRELGRCAQAIEAMKAGLELEPDRSSTYYHLAVCYSEVGRHGEAALAMEEYRRRSD